MLEDPPSYLKESPPATCRRDSPPGSPSGAGGTKGLIGLLAVLLAACSGADPEVELPLYVFEGPIMGTYYRVKVAGVELSRERQELLHGAVREKLEEVDGRMSTYLPDSELSRFNRHAETTAFAISKETLEVLAAALEVSAATGGSFDVTVGPLVEVWGFRPATEAPPSVDPAAVRKALGGIGFDKLEIDPEALTARKSRGDLHCDLSGIAKGYAVDRVAERLERLEITSYWVEVGGEVRAAGRNSRGTPWRLGIERPRLAPGSVQRIVPLSNLAVATSGDYRNYREIDGQRFSHIIDPRTGWPIRHRLASVSVFHPRCMIADALATALMVMGAEEGYELAIERGLPVFFLVREGDGFSELATPAFWRLAGVPEVAE